MEKNYNYTRRKMFLPEYGRHIHEMVDYLGTIDDREERTRQAHVVIDVMGNLNPLLRDTSDIAHKLWDHLFIMADFDLDVDSPYPIPTRKDLRPQPDKLEYPRKNMMFKHYGKSVERMINSLRDNPDQKAVEATLENIARYMRTKSYEYNQEHPNNEVIIGDIKRMSRGELALDEQALGALKSEYKVPVQHTGKRQGGKNGRNTRGGGQGQRRGGRAFGLTAIVTLGCWMVSCGGDGARVSGQLIGAGDRPVYLERVIPGAEATADTVMTNSEGHFEFRVELPDGEPTIYNLRSGDDMVPLLVSRGERVKVMSFGDLGEGYRVSGSPSSEKVWELHGILSRGAASLDSISSLYALSGPEGELRERLSRAYIEKYFAIKRSQIRFIVENSSSLAGVYALYQRLPGDGVLFNGPSDHVYYRMVADSVSRRWPDSRYVVALQREVEQNNAALELQNRIDGAAASELDYPDIELPNMYGQNVRLSSMAGRVVVLDFWSATAVEGNLGNVALKELWDEFSASGLDIYQVSLDTSRPLWVNAVQEQKLPWTTVCDFRGVDCVAARVWNVTGLPANFVIDRKGNVVGRNLFGEDLRRKIRELL